jgi:3-oxoacyl-(acyl-carrier-protein) synthase
LGALDTPVVSYKAQIGYLMASSALVDLAIMTGYLDSGSLPAFTCEGEVDVGLSINLHANKLAHPLSGSIGIKIGLGIEGSVGAAVVRSLRSRSISR